MLWFWFACGLLLAVIYMAAYVLLRTSEDGRAWHQRLRRPGRR